jgi:hypothetical protein
VSPYSPHRPTSMSRSRSKSGLSTVSAHWAAALCGGCPGTGLALLPFHADTGRPRTSHSHWRRPTSQTWTRTPRRRSSPCGPCPWGRRRRRAQRGVRTSSLATQALRLEQRPRTRARRHHCRPRHHIPTRSLSPARASAASERVAPVQQSTFRRSSTTQWPVAVQTRVYKSYRTVTFVTCHSSLSSSSIVRISMPKQ